MILASFMYLMKCGMQICLCLNHRDQLGSSYWYPSRFYMRWLEYCIDEILDHFLKLSTIVLFHPRSIPVTYVGTNWDTKFCKRSTISSIRYSIYFLWNQVHWYPSWFLWF